MRRRVRGARGSARKPIIGAADDSSSSRAIARAPHPTLSRGGEGSALPLFAAALPKPPPPGVSMTNTSPGCTSILPVAASSTRLPSVRSTQLRPGAPVLAAGEAEGRDAAAVGEHRRGHRLAEADAAHDAVAAAMLALPAAAAADAEALDEAPGSAIRAPPGRSGANWSCACARHRCRRNPGRRRSRRRSSRNTGSARCRR